jgi:hypothetical protein
MLLCPFWQLAGTDELSTTDTFGSLSAITKKKQQFGKKSCPFWSKAGTDEPYSSK